MIFHRYLLNSSKENSQKNLYIDVQYPKGRKEKLWLGTWKYMKEVMKHNFLESDQKTTGPEYSNSHIPSWRYFLQARLGRALSSEQQQKC